MDGVVHTSPVAAVVAAALAFGMDAVGSALRQASDAVAHGRTVSSDDVLSTLPCGATAAAALATVQCRYCDVAFQDAEPLPAEALTALNAAHAANVKWSSGDDARAVAAFDAAVSALQRVCAAPHHYLLLSLQSRRVDALIHAAAWDRAVEVLTDTVPLLWDHCPACSPLPAIAALQAGKILHLLDRCDAAIAHLGAALRRLEVLVGQGHPLAVSASELMTDAQLRVRSR